MQEPNPSTQPPLPDQPFPPGGWPTPDSPPPPTDKPTIDWHGGKEPGAAEEPASTIPGDLSEAQWLDELNGFDIWKDSEIDPADLPLSTPAAPKASVEPRKERSKLARAGSTAADGVAGVTVAAEISPANEALRVAAFAAAQKAGLDPVQVGMVYGGATMAIESAAAMAAARLLHTDRGRSMADKTSALVEKGLNKVGLDKSTVYNPAMKAGTALVGGSAVTTIVNNLEDPERTKSQDRKFGFILSVGLAGFCAVQGYLMSRGISHPEPESVGTGVLALGSAFVAGGWLKRRARLEREARKVLEAQQTDEQIE